jgi:hypothetical protein
MRRRTDTALGLALLQRSFIRRTLAAHLCDVILEAYGVPLVQLKGGDHE